MNEKESGAEIAKYVIPVKNTILQALQAINDNWKGMVLVHDSGKRIVGVISDGDIRRGLLRGMSIDSTITEIINTKFFSVKSTVGRAEVLDIMMARSIRAVPVLDDSGQLQGIHFLNDLLGISTKPNTAVIMAGGKGMRLRPLTENCPKPMIQVAGRPILERIVLHLVGCGIRNIYLSINYLGDQIENYFGDGSKLGCSIEYLREDEPLGTGGPLSLLPPQEYPVIVMNGDQITQADIVKLLRSHEEEEVVATIGIQHYQTKIPFGVVKHERGRLLALQEKPTITCFINTGIYILNPDIISMVPKNEEFPVTALFDLLLEQNRSIGVNYIEEDWIDVGRHDDLSKASGHRT